ncbi:MAG TPA: sigma-70 family RNA polymerase sigma factor [Longimicrobiaceae bacterium]
MTTTLRRYSTTAVAPVLEHSSGAGTVAPVPAEADPVDYSGLPDEELFELYQEGDHEAFTNLVNRYEPLIKGFLFKRLKDEERVQDLAQDTFLRVHRARERYDSGRKFSTWIYTIASNLLKNEYRNRSRRRETAFSDLRAEGTAPRPVEFESDSVDPERFAYRGELREAIEEAIDQLEDHHRIPFVMREVEDRTYEEISEAIGVPVGTVKSRLFRARNAFQALLPISLS